MDRIVEILSGLPIDFSNVYIAILRIIAPVLMAVILWRAGRPLLTFEKQPEVWANLILPDGLELPVTHWENIIGRHPQSDLVIDLLYISKNHAVLTRYDDGSWTITDTDSSGGVTVNGEPVQIYALMEGDVIGLNGVEVRLVPTSEEQERTKVQVRRSGATLAGSAGNLLLLTLFQMMSCLAFLLNG